MKLEIDIKKMLGDFTLETQCVIEGHRTGLFGPSGSGKSTIVHLLAGLMKPDSGSIQIDGEPVFCSEKAINTPSHKRRIGVVFQNACLFDHLSVKKNLFYGWRRTPAEKRKIEPEKVFRVLALENLLRRRVHSLSGGEKQRVALARTMLASPRLVLMDEPLNGLDDTIKFQIIPFLNKILDEFKIPMIFISHSLLEMRLLADDVLVIRDGLIESQLSAESMARNSWTDSRVGYLNIMELTKAGSHNNLFLHDWNGTQLILTEQGDDKKNLFELDAREILLFKKHPQAASARNLLKCEVTRILTSDNRARIELKCSGNILIAQIVPESVRELDISIGSEVIAAIKASAFRRLA